MTGLIFLPLSRVGRENSITLEWLGITISEGRVEED